MILRLLGMCRWEPDGETEQETIGAASGGFVFAGTALEKGPPNIQL